MDPGLLAILCCPQSGQPVHVASAGERSAFGAEGELLVREDGLVAYPVKDGIPALVPEAAIPRPE